VGDVAVVDVLEPVVGPLLLLFVKDVVDDLEADKLEAKGGNLSAEVSPVVRLRCFDEIFEAG